MLHNTLLQYVAWDSDQIDISYILSNFFKNTLLFGQYAA